MLTPFLSIPVSLILMAGTAFCLAKASKGSSWVIRLNHLLHALMALGMLGMIWHNVDLPLLPQLLLFGVASFWFLLQAVSRHEFALGCHGGAKRLACLYHAAMLAAMVFMLAILHPAVPSERATYLGLPSHHASQNHHALTVTVPSVRDVSPLWTQSVTQVLALFFAAAVLAWLLPTNRAVAKLPVERTPGVNGRSDHRPIILERSFEAGTALAMSLMFAASSL